MDVVESKAKHYRLLTNSKLPALTKPEKFAIVTSSPVHGKFLLKQRWASGRAPAASGTECHGTGSTVW